MFKIILMSLLNRRRALSLILAAITLTVFLVVGVQRAREISRSSFSRTISGTDIILGARTGQINLVLYSVFHIGNPTANVSYDSYLELSGREGVSWAVPLSLGDSHRGYRVVGTTRGFFEHYTYGRDEALVFARGEAFDDTFDVVVGAAVAEELDYTLGDSVVVTHGQGRGSIHQHDDQPFSISGILGPTGTPADRAVYISLEAYTAIHIGWDSGMRVRSVSREETDARDLTPDSITAALIGLDTPQLAFQYQRAVNTYGPEPLSAILPGVALYELWQLMSVAERALTGVSIAVVLVGLLSLVATQVAVLESRRREMAILRSLGATPSRLALILFGESSVVTLAGCILGLALLYGVQAIAQTALTRLGFYARIAPPSAIELLVIGAVFVAGSIAGIAPAIQTYRRTLHDGLSIRG